MGRSIKLPGQGKKGVVHHSALGRQVVQAHMLPTIQPPPLSVPCLLPLPHLPRLGIRKAPDLLDDRPHRRIP